MHSDCILKYMFFQDSAKQAAIEEGERIDGIVEVRCSSVLCCCTKCNVVFLCNLSYLVQSGMLVKNLNIRLLAALSFQLTLLNCLQT